MTGDRPIAVFGNSTGDRQMLKCTWAGGAARLSMLAVNDNATLEYANCPAQGLLTAKVGTFPRNPVTSLGRPAGT